jgi:[acyl-carrier-protein] S-malonyltransferase
MVAVIGLEASEVERLCSDHAHVYPVNYNCPGQISVAGLKSEFEAFTKDIKAAGGRVIPLRVKGAFHSPFMASAAEAFGEALKGVMIKTPTITLYSNYTGAPYCGDFSELLRKQISNPVRWQEIITHMIGQGVDTFIELGPGTTLCGLIKKIDPSVQTFHVEDCTSLEQAVEGAANAEK